jgi:NAD(P)H-hydrate epimerase
MIYLSRDEVRNVDRRAIEEFGIPGVVLMENAGRGAAELLLSLGVRGQVVICCGKGNNGGDGFVVARHLDIHEVSVQILLFVRPEELTGDAAINYQIAAKAGLPIAVHVPLRKDRLEAELAAGDWIVDALFGTGLVGPVRPPLDEVIAAINRAAHPEPEARTTGPRPRVLAIDIPSGLDCDTGLPMGPTVRADHTATFVAQKKGFANRAAQPWLGQVHVVHIGVPRRLMPVSTQ